MQNLVKYKDLNTAKMYREFKEEYGHPNMQITSYRRVLYGASTYLIKGHSPYIIDMFKFFAEKTKTPFLNVAYDLLDAEFFGKKNTLLDVLKAELNMIEEDTISKEDKIALKNIRLCDLNKDNEKIYYKIKNNVQKRG